MKKLFFPFLIAISCYSITLAQTTITIQPDEESGKDALLHGLYSEVNTNYGNNPQFVASVWTFGGTPGIIRSVIEFNLASIPSNATITSAQLSLFATDNTSGMVQHSNVDGPNNAWLEKLTSYWDESTVTWNNQPTTTLQNRVSLAASTSSTENYLNINVLAIVQDMHSNPSLNYGFMIKLQTEDYKRCLNFCSSDHSNPSLRPKLVVTYTTPSGVNENIVAANNISVYPNPANDLISVNVNQNLIGSFYTLSDYLGKVILTDKLTSLNLTLNIKDLAKGMYFIKVNGNNQQSVKLIKN